MNIMKTEDYDPAYAITIAKVDAITPIPGYDRIVVATINGISGIVSNSVVAGDLVAAVPEGARITHEYLYEHSLYSARELNKDTNAHGYFAKDGIVKGRKIAGTRSYVFVIPLDEYDLGDVAEGESFDAVTDGTTQHTLVVRPNIVEDPTPTHKKTDGHPTPVYIPEPIKYTRHYDTPRLDSPNTDKTAVTPFASATITIKIHGTSVIIGYTKLAPTKRRGIVGAIQRLWRMAFPKYGIWCASRNRLRPLTDPIYGVAAQHLAPYLQKNMVVYGEIAGPGIQTNYDYGTRAPKFMPYRIVSVDDDCNTVTEVSMGAVIRYGEYLEGINSEYFMRPTVVFEGNLSELAESDCDIHTWRSKLLDKIAASFGLEELEPLCENKVVREGIVMRIQNHAFKYKSRKFMEKNKQ